MFNQQQHEIVIEIQADGQIKGEVQGVEGPTCGTLSAWLNELGEVTEDRATPDYYKRGQQGVTLKR